MADVAPLARSPIPPAEPVGVVAGWLVGGRRSRAALRLADHTPLTKIAVRAERDGAVATHLGVPLGRAVRDGNRLTASFAPGEWLLLGPPGRPEPPAAELEEVAPSGELVTVLDVTHGRVLLRLTGSAAPETLAKICALDLDDRVTSDGAALRTNVAAVVTDIVRDDVGGQRSYLLGCEWSSGQYLHDAVLEAGREFGIDRDGFHPDAV